MYADGEYIEFSQLEDDIANYSDLLNVDYETLDEAEAKVVISKVELLNSDRHKFAIIESINRIVAIPQPEK